jgi:hypothetical protein
MDESGDLGFNAQSSKFFVVSYVVFKNQIPHYARHKVTTLLKRLNTRNRLKISEFKFSNDTPKTRCRFLKLIASLNLDIGVIAISKDSVKDELKSEPSVLYNYLTVHYVVKTIIEKYFRSWHHYNTIDFTIDRSLLKAARARYNKYFEEKLNYVKFTAGFKGDITVKIDHRDSMAEPCIQIVDYISGAIRHMIEYSDSQYYNKIKNKIKYKEKWDYNSKISW